MTIKQHRRWWTATAKSCGLLSAALLSGCLNDGSELIPPEPGRGTTTSNLVVGNSSTPGVPNYVWTVGAISFLDVVRTTKPKTPEKNNKDAGGADKEQSPVLH